MEENSNKIAYSKNMNKFTFNTTLTIPIDSNANIKTILDVNTFLFDQKVECGNGKAILSGKIGVRVFYLDTDNMTNSVYDHQSFNETYLDNFITSDTFINVLNYSIVNDVLSAENNLKINCEVSLTPVAYMNLMFSNKLNLNELLITKNSEINANTISNYINTKFDHTLNLETKDTVSKILCYNTYFAPEKYSAEDGFMIVEGKIMSNIVYETASDESVLVKQLNESTNIKCDVEISNLKKNDALDLSFMIDKSCSEISTELEDNNSLITIKNKIQVCGVSFNEIALNIVDDLFSTDNEIEATIAKREYTKKNETITLSEIISNEVSLANNDPAIDEVVANLNMTPEITNTYLKDSNIYIEGVVTSNLVFINENKELQHKQIEIPFIINTKIQTETLDCVHSDVSILDNKTKVKRGTIIEMEYALFISLNVYEKESRDIVDNFNIGKPLDFSKYDFQIYLGKPNETLWELCKRIKISPNDIHKHNKDLPLVMQGGEKIIIKR